MNAANLPPVFALPIKDAALAPLLTIGDIGMFSKDRPPIAGKPVLFKDSRGGAYVRDYVPKPGGGWIASAKNPAYESIDSTTEELEVIATMTGFEWSR